MLKDQAQLRVRQYLWDLKSMPQFLIIAVAMLDVYVKQRHPLNCLGYILWARGNKLHHITGEAYLVGLQFFTFW